MFVRVFRVFLGVLLVGVFWKGAFGDGSGVGLLESTDVMTEVLPIDPSRTVVVFLRPPKTGSKTCVNVMMTLLTQAKFGAAPTSKQCRGPGFFVSAAMPAVTAATQEKAQLFPRCFPYDLGVFPEGNPLVGRLSSIWEDRVVGEMPLVGALRHEAVTVTSVERENSVVEESGHAGCVLPIAYPERWSKLTAGLGECLYVGQWHTHVLDSLFAVGLALRHGRPLTYSDATMEVLESRQPIPRQAVEQPDTRLVVSLRKPVDRLRSELKHRAYHYHQNNEWVWGKHMPPRLLDRLPVVNETTIPKEALDEVMVEVVNDPSFADIARNRQVKMLSGLTSSLDGEDGFAAPMDAPQRKPWATTALSVAMRVVEASDAVFLLERIEESVVLAMHRWDWVPLLDPEHWPQELYARVLVAAEKSGTLFRPEPSSKNPNPAATGFAKASLLPWDDLVAAAHVYCAAQTNKESSDQIKIEADQNEQLSPKLQQVYHANALDTKLWEFASQLLTERLAVAKTKHHNTYAKA